MIMQRTGIAFRDTRYTADLEYCGYPERRFVLRFCGVWIAQFQTAKEARAAQREHAARKGE